jgi:pyruvate,water dikinase
VYRRTGVSDGRGYSVDPQTGRRDSVLLLGSHGEVVVRSRIAGLAVAERRGEFELSDEQCTTLARLVERAAWTVSDGEEPQAVDWRFNGRRFSLGKPEPIADIPKVAPPLAVKQKAMWSNGNLKDAIAGVPTTASWSFIAPYLRSIFFAPIERLGYSVPPGMEVVRRIEGRAYLDLTSLQAIYYDALGVLPSATNRTLGGLPAEIEVPPPTPELEREWSGRKQRAVWLLLRHQMQYPKAIARMHRAARAAMVDLKELSNPELMALAERIGRRQEEFGPVFQVGNFEAGAWTEPLEQLIERSLPGQGQRIAAGLMAGGGGVTSAQHGYRLVELAQLASTELAARAAVVGGEMVDSLPDDSPFLRALSRFLAEFGHRGIYEAELANPRWIEDPSFLLDQVRQILLEGAASAPASDRRRAAEAELRKLPFTAQMVARWLAQRARRSAALREAGKSALIAIALPVRMILLEYGRRLVMAGVIDAAEDVFHLSRADLETYVRGDWDGSDFRELVAQRRSLREERLASPPPADLMVEGRTGLRLEGQGQAASATLRGIRAAPGRACGPARLIHHPSEAQRLQRGDVLVAPSTDPGWTPLFLRTAAVVTEVGGFLSHGAIVAREFGIPAVVNVPRVLSTLVDGEMVCVDGDTGTIERQG